MSVAEAFSKQEKGDRQHRMRMLRDDQASPPIVAPISEYERSVILSECGTHESNAEREALPRDLEFSKNPKLYPAAKYPFFCVAEKRWIYRLYL